MDLQHAVVLVASAVGMHHRELRRKIGGHRPQSGGG
jgi:hypothetical protein